MSYDKQLLKKVSELIVQPKRWEQEKKRIENEIEEKRANAMKYRRAGFNAIASQISSETHKLDQEKEKLEKEELA